MLDTSASMTANLELLKRAAEQFLIRLLPEDKAQVGAFNDKIELSADSRTTATNSSRDVKDLDFGNATRLYDALAASLDELARHRRPPRRSGVHRRRRHGEPHAASER